VLNIRPEENSTQFEKRINKNLNACGCRTGEIFILLGMIGISLTIVLKPFGYTSLNLEFFLFSSGIILFLAFLGKVMGLLIAHINLKRDLIRLQNRIGKN
jgi:hypothetical protein